jgi:hypothetical protein
LKIGPGGDLFYVDIKNGTVHRITYTAANQAPTAAFTANPTSGPVPLTVNFDGTGSSDPEGKPLTYSWVPVREVRAGPRLWNRHVASVDGVSESRCL